MGTMYGFLCKKCGFEAELGDEQPYYLMSGPVQDKYCPEIDDIVTIRPGEVSCQAYKDENCEACKNCKGDCLKDIEMKKNGKYKCPRCGGTLGLNPMVVIINAD